MIPQWGYLATLTQVTFEAQKMPKTGRWIFQNNMSFDIELHKYCVCLFMMEMYYVMKEYIFVSSNGYIANIGSPTSNNSIDCKGKLVTPGFIDSHTHPIFDNNRNEEHQQRLLEKPMRK